MSLEKFDRKVTEIELCGHKWKFAALTMADFAKFRGRIVEQREAINKKRRERIMADAKTIGDIDPMSLLDKLDKPPTEEEVEAEMETIEGMGYLAFLSLRRTHQSITEEDVMDLVTLDAVEKIATALFGVATDSKKKRARQLIKKS